MKRKYRRMLEQQAKEHNVRLTGTLGVKDETTLHIALLAICEASQELILTGDTSAITHEIHSGVVVSVTRNA